jgi:hypothetical protein
VDQIHVHAKRQEGSVARPVTVSRLMAATMQSEDPLGAASY